MPGKDRASPAHASTSPTKAASVAAQAPAAAAGREGLRQTEGLAAQQTSVRPKPPGFAAGLHFWHALTAEQQTQLATIWESQLIRKAEWDHLLSGLRSQQWAFDIQSALSSRFHFRDPARVSRDARIGVPPEGILIATRSKGWIASDGQVHTNEDLYASIRGIEKMAEVSAELTMILTGMGTSVSFGRMFETTRKGKGLEMIVEGLGAFDDMLSICRVVTDDPDVLATIDAAKLAVPFVRGKLDVAKSAKEAMDSGADVAQGLGLVAHIAGESLRAVDLAAKVAADTPGGARAAADLAPARSAMQKVLTNLGKALESR